MEYLVNFLFTVNIVLLESSWTLYSQLPILWFLDLLKLNSSQDST